MGSTSYTNTTAEAAKQMELIGCEVLARSGNWYIFKNPSGYIGLTHFIVQRYGNEVNVKAVDITMGPLVTPPKSIAKKFVAYYNGNAYEAGGEYGAPVLRQALSENGKAPKKYARGDKFVVEHLGHWDSGAPVSGTYTFISAFRARRETGEYVRLPRTWRRTWNHKPLAN